MFKLDRYGFAGLQSQLESYGERIDFYTWLQFESDYCLEVGGRFLVLEEGFGFCEVLF